jgi:hypothetical protein
MGFGAYGANLDLISPEAFRRRMRGGLIAWYELMSYPMQQEAARRAQKLHAHIWAVKNRPANYEIRDDKKRFFILVFDKTIGAPAWQANYRISRLRIGWTNFVRKFNYPYYGGAGEPVRYQRWQNVKYYLLLRHEWLDRLNIARASARDDARNPDITFGEAVRRRRPETYSRYQFMTYLIFFSWMKIFGR